MSTVISRVLFSFGTKQIEGSDLLDNAERFANHLDGFTQADLERPFADSKYGDYQKNMNVLIEHSYYHLGQIALIKKMIREGA